jgi:exosortase
MTEDTSGSSQASEVRGIGARGVQWARSWRQSLRGGSVRAALREPGVWGLLALASLFFVYRDLIGYDPTVAVRLQADGSEGALFEPVGGSPHLMFGVVLWIIWRRRHRFEVALAAPRGGFVVSWLLLPALALGSWSLYVNAPDLLIVSLMLLLMGGAALLGGAAGARSMQLPALLLLFALPIPPVLLNQVMFPLQMLTVSLSEWALYMLGIPALVHGDQILTSRRIFQVIETCSGLRIIETLMMAALVYSELLGRSRRHATLLLLCAPVVGIFVNMLRVLSIILNPYSEFAAIHSTQGIVMLIGGVLLLAGVDLGLERLLRRKVEATPSVPKPSGASGRPPAWRWTVFATGILLLVAATLWLPAWEAPRRTGQRIAAFPAQLDGFRTRGLRLDDSFLGSVQFSEWVHRGYEGEGGEVDVFLGADDRRSRLSSLMSEKTAIPGSGWSIEERWPISLRGFPEAEAFIVSSARDGERRLVYHWYEGVESVSAEALRWFVALDQSPLRRPRRAVVARLATPIPQRPDGLEIATARLDQFVDIARPELQALGLP